MSLHIYVVRHGETEWSISGRHTGRTDIPLTERGQQQARSLAEPLHGMVFTQVLASPRRRAQHTCELAGLGTALHIEPMLSEWDYGDYEGLKSVDIHKLRTGWSIFNDGCPGGETPAQVATRADQLLQKLRPLDGNVALFTHGHFGRVLATRWIGLPIAAAQHFALSPASLSILEYDPRHAGIAVIAQWNSTAHLAREQAAAAPPGR